MKTKKITAILLIVVIVAGLLAGCGGSSNSLIDVEFNDKTYRISSYLITSAGSNNHTVVIVNSLDFSDKENSPPFYCSFISDDGEEHTPFMFYATEIGFGFTFTTSAKPKKLIFYDPNNTENKYELDCE